MRKSSLSLLIPALLIIASPAWAQKGKYFETGPKTYFPGHGGRFNLNDITLLDFDSDGDLDLLAATCDDSLDPDEYGEAPLLSLKNDGTGRFEAAKGKFVGNVKAGCPGTWGLADFTGDGRMDVLIPDEGCDCFDESGEPLFPLGGQTLLLVQKKQGGLKDVTAKRFPNDVDSGASVSTADVDGDGDIDAFVSYFPEGSIRVYAGLYINQGKGRFVREDHLLPSFVSDGIDIYGGVVFLDVEGDGDPDLYLGEWADPGHESSLLLNDGTGNFFPAADGAIPPDPDPNVGVHTATSVDLDCDGDVDLLIGYGSTPEHPAPDAVAFWQNQADGTFVNRSRRVRQVDLLNVKRFYVADLNGDTWPDIAAKTHGHPHEALTGVWLNTGKKRGKLLRSAAKKVPRMTDRGEIWQIVPGDLDQDGDVDLFAIDNENYFTITNLRPYKALKKPCVAE